MSDAALASPEPQSEPKSEPVLNFSYSRDGDLMVQVAGTWGALLPSGALWLEAERMLICADLHLEKGSAYASRGQLLPPYDTRETLRRLAGEGDVSHAETAGIGAVGRQDQAGSIRDKAAPAHAA